MEPIRNNASNRVAKISAAKRERPVMSATGVIVEAEVSVTATCSLACNECGFMVPRQVRPYARDAASELAESLAALKRVGVSIASLAVVGGEATMAPKALERVLMVALESDVVRGVELVTNGLTPRGLTPGCLSLLHRVTLSDYTADDRLAMAWRRWLDVRAPHVAFGVRRHTSWDANAAHVDLGEAGGQAVFDRCWYRRHCVTLERGRMFVCSRIAKLALDDQGLRLDGDVTREMVDAHLHAQVAPLACRTCTPMAGLAAVAPGVQPDDRLSGLRRRALSWLEGNV